MTPYYADESVTLFHGDMRDVLPTLGRFDLCCTDPPYGETSLPWDRWPVGWPVLVAEHTDSLWCFGSMRMFLERVAEFAGWRFSQDVVWEKSRGGLTVDRFVRVHEHATHWYRGVWGDLGLTSPREKAYGPRIALPTRPGKQQGVYGAIGRDTGWEDDGSRGVRSVIRVASVRQGQQTGVHSTQKPLGILDPLISYACPPGGTVLDPFAGSGSALVAARASGRRAVGIEAYEGYCEAAARRLAQGDLFGGVA